MRWGSLVMWFLIGGLGTTLGTFAADWVEARYGRSMSKRIAMILAIWALTVGIFVLALGWV